jgi:hypothetical protein
MSSLSSSLPFLLARHLADTANSTIINGVNVHDNDGYTDGYTASSQTPSTFNSTVFWCVNAFILCMLVTACLSCRYGSKYLLILTRQASDHHARQNSDLAFIRHQLAREAARAAASKESPARRKQRVMDSFRRCQVTMVRTIEYVWECIRQLRPFSFVLLEVRKRLESGRDRTALYPTVVFVWWLGRARRKGICFGGLRNEKRNLDGMDSISLYQFFLLFLIIHHDRWSSKRTF